MFGRINWLRTTLLGKGLPSERSKAVALWPSDPLMLVWAL